MYQNPLSKDYSWGCKNGSAGKNISCSPKELDFDSQPPHQVAPSHLRLQLLGNQYLYSDTHRDTHKHMRRGEQQSRAKVLTPHSRHTSTRSWMLHPCCTELQTLWKLVGSNYQRSDWHGGQTTTWGCFHTNYFKICGPFVSIFKT